jgi:hypothetical protein
MTETAVTEALRKDARLFCSKVVQGLGDSFTCPGDDHSSSGDLIMKRIEAREIIVMITGPNFQPHLVFVDEELKHYMDVMQ